MQINDSSSIQESAKKQRDRRTNIRDEYFAERARIVEQLGNLDQIRATLGLNRRQMCRLLLVDPSAWTRWVSSDAPPHIYQALRWLLELRGIRPDVVGPVNLSARLDEIQSSMHRKIHDLERHIEMLERTLALTRVVVEREAIAKRVVKNIVKTKRKRQIRKQTKLRTKPAQRRRKPHRAAKKRRTSRTLRRRPKVMKRRKSY